MCAGNSRSSTGICSWPPCVSVIGAPTSATVMSRSSSISAFSASRSCRRQCTRSSVSRDQSDSSNATRAAAMARSMSAASPSAAAPSGSSVAGLMVAKVPPPPRIRSPSISSGVVLSSLRGAIVNPVAGPQSPGRAGIVELGIRPLGDDAAGGRTEVAVALRPDGPLQIRGNLVVESPLGVRTHVDEPPRRARRLTALATSRAPASRM